MTITPNSRQFRIRMYKRLLIILPFLLGLILSACASPSPDITPPTAAVTLYPTITPKPDVTKTPAAATSDPLDPTPSEPVYDPADPVSWKSLPVVPVLSAEMLETFKLGLEESHNNPNAFSKIGDCETAADWFLKDFDIGPKNYHLGDHAGLQETIDHFKGSFGRKSLAAQNGFLTVSVISTAWTDMAACKKEETPLMCEYRLHRPSFALIMFGTNDARLSRKTFEGYLRQIIDSTLKQHIVPILVTKADNLEGDESINAIIARVAYENNVPLWNQWAALQNLPAQGLQQDGVHLVYARNFFDDPEMMQAGWPVRNLTALQVLDAMRRQTQPLVGE